MKKKLLSIIAAAAMVASVASPVIAEDKTPTVYVNSSEIFFDDQEPVILGEGTTLVPARGVFESMGAKVEWDEENQQVNVTSSDNKKVIKLVIGDAVMRAYDMSGIFSAIITGQDFNAPETKVTLDVVPQIINDRTMIPLRAISETLDADVQWNDKDYAIDITTKNAPSADAGAPAYSLSASTLTAAAGETVDVYVDAANIVEGTFVSGVTATIKYDKDKFEFVNAALMNGDTVIEGAMGVTNPDFTDNHLKSVYITIDGEKAAKTDGHVMKLTFKSLNGKKGEFLLSSGYHTRLGYNTTLLLDSLEEGGDTVTYEGDSFKVSSDVLVINGENTVSTATPEVTSAPEATNKPDASATPQVTVTPEATSAPEATNKPDASVAPMTTAEPTATPAA